MKEKLLIKIIDFLWKAENLLDQIVEDSPDQFGEEEELFISLSAEISNIRKEILNRFRYPKLEELSIEQIIVAIKFGMKNITEVYEMNYMKRLLYEVENGRLENNRCEIEWEIRKWHLNRLRNG